MPHAPCGPAEQVWDEYFMHVTRELMVTSKTPAASIGDPDSGIICSIFTLLHLREGDV